MNCFGVEGAVAVFRRLVESCFILLHVLRFHYKRAWAFYIGHVYRIRVLHQVMFISVPVSAAAHAGVDFWQ